METKILITGAKGFIGSHLLKFYPGADTLDLKDGQDIRTFEFKEEYTHIFHLAALRSAPLGEEIPEEFISTNCWGTVRLLKRYPNARIMNITSASAEKVRGVYGATKKFAEIIGSFYPNVLNVRPYNVFGEGQGVESGAVVPLFIKAYLTGKVPIVYGNGHQMRDFTYVGDVVEEMKKIMFNPRRPVIRGELFHCGYSRSITIVELIKLIWGKLPSIEFGPRRSFDILESKSPYTISKFIGREEGLKRTIEWMRTTPGQLT